MPALPPGAPAAPAFGAPGGDPWQYLPETGYCSWAFVGRDAGCGTGGDYCWSVGLGDAFGPGTITVLRRAFGGAYTVQGSNLYMGSMCSPGVTYPVDYAGDFGVVVAFEQAAVAVAVGVLAWGRVLRG